MLLEETQRVMNTLNERYVKRYGSGVADCHKIVAYKQGGNHVVEFFVDSYSLKAWFDAKNEFHIENASQGRSIFDYADEFGWTKDDVDYMRFGIEPVNTKIKNAARIEDEILDSYVYAGEFEDGHYFITDSVYLNSLDDGSDDDQIKTVQVYKICPWDEDEKTHKRVVDILSLLYEPIVITYKDEEARAIIQQIQKVLK